MNERMNAIKSICSLGESIPAGLAQSVDNNSDEYAVSITFFHLPATLLSFPDYVLPHLSLVQSHDPENFNHS